MKVFCPNCRRAFSEERCSCGYQVHPFLQFPMALPEYAILGDRYVIEKVLGAGGFGITYQVLDVQGGGKYAVKEFVPAGVARRERTGELLPETEAKSKIYLHARKRFMEEAMTLKRLAYIPQVAAITDYFYENNSAYFVMEFLQGRTLRQLVGQKGALPAAQAMQIIQDAGSALERIHTDYGIFHRDISPENIMLCDNGDVKLIDFGSAKDLARRTNQFFTIILKAGYAPPEQYSATTPQGRYSDVYALAGTLYYLLTHTSIPDAPSRINGASYPPLAQVRPDIGQAVSDAVDRALLLNRRERTQTVAEFLQQLRSTPALTQTPDASCRQIHVSWRGSTRSWSIESDRTVWVGRSAGNAVQLPEDARLSKWHLLVCYDTETGQYIVKDVSRNGTYLQQTRLQKNRLYCFPPQTQLRLCGGVCELLLE